MTTQIIANDTSSLFDAITFPIPLDQDWITSAAASSNIWSATGQWLNTELDFDKQGELSPEEIEQAEAKQAKMAGIIGTMLPLLRGKMAAVDFEGMINQMLTKSMTFSPKDLEAQAIENARLLGTDVETERKALEAVQSKPNPFRMERAKFSSLYATKLKHEVEVQGARELDPYELLNFTEKLYQQLVGVDNEEGVATPDTPRDKRNGSPSAIKRAAADVRRFSLPALKMERAAVHRLLIEAAKEIDGLSKLVLNLIREQESAGYEPDVDNPMH